jgi:ATP-binding cassette subfamily C protein
LINQLKRTLRILPPKINKRRFIPVFLFILISSWLEALGVGIVFPLVKVIADPSSVQSSGLLSNIYSALGAPGEGAFLQLLTAAVLVIFVIKNAFYVFMMNFNLRVVKESEAALCEELLLGYLQAPWANHLKRNSGDLLHSIMIAPRQVHISVLWPALEVCVEILTLLMIGTLLFVADPIMMFAATGFVVIAMFVFLKVIPPRMAALGMATVRIGKSSTVAIQQALGGVKEAKVLGREKFFWNVFSKEAQERAIVERHQKILQTISRPVAETVLMAGMLSSILIVLSVDREGTDVIATLSLFAIAAIRLLTSFNRLATGIAMIRNSLPMLDEIYDDVMSYRVAMAQVKDKADEVVVPIEHVLSLENIRYQYPGRDDAVLDDISLSIDRGHSVALVGSSGAGKTTLADIILGLLEPQEGKIVIDGREVTRQRAWRQNLFGYVPQSIYLLDDTLRANIAFGLASDQVDETNLREAVELACIQDLVDSLPDGLDTVVGEGGVRMSGGERQRLGIARALYHRPEFIVFDEATSALDNVTERKFSDALDELHGRRTVIFIAHRLSTIERCDKIVLLGDGRVVAQGTYAELMENCDPFKQMALANHEDTSIDV